MAEGTVNYSNPGLDRTVKIFDDFYKFSINVQSEEYEIVFSYFKSIYTDVTAAANMAVTLFRISNSQQIPVLTLLNELKSTAAANRIDLNMQMAYYLNSMRSGSTLLGVSQSTQPNFYAARNIRP